MVNPTDQAIRATKTIALARTIKRMRYDERQIIQVLRLSSDKAKALMEGRLDGFTTEEITKSINALD